MSLTKEALPPAYGYLCSVHEDGSTVTFLGWMLSLAGPFERLELLGLDGSRGTAEVVRNQVLAQAIPHVKGAELGGFSATARIPAGAGAAATLEFRLVGWREGKPAAVMPIGCHRWSNTKLPPEDVRVRACGNPGEAFYLACGMNDCHDFLRALRPHVDVAAVSELLEWGSGAGRLTRHFIQLLPKVHVHGTDIDEEAVRWADANLDGTFVPCGKEPPLPYPAGKFDVIVCCSVFTHLQERYQYLWLAELHRVLKPGGTLLFTTHGDHYVRWEFPDAQASAAVLRTGFSDSRPDFMLGHVAGADYYRGTYQSYEWTKKAISRYFEFLSFTAGGKSCLQDIWVMRKK